MAPGSAGPGLRYLLASVFVVAMASGSAGSSLSSFRQQQLPGTAMPPALEKLASPLSPLHTQQASSTYFCSSAGVYCPMKDIAVSGTQPSACLQPFLYSYHILHCPSNGNNDDVSAVEAAGGMFFLQEALTERKTVQLPNTSKDLKGLRFLPDSLAEALPELKEQNMLELAKFYGIEEGSDMELALNVGLAHCGYKSENEITACHISGESMVSFVANTVGHDAHVYTPPAVAMQEATVVGVSKLSLEGSKVAACHDMQFPSLLYSCHMTQTAQLMNVELKLADGKVLHMPAVCHMDTSYWNPSHAAFQVLKTEPGQSPLCHWLPENSFIFTQGTT